MTGLRLNFLEDSSFRLLIALALSLAAHGALMFYIPFDAQSVGTRPPPTPLKISMVQRVPAEPVRSEISSESPAAPPTSSGQLEQSDADEVPRSTQTPQRRERPQETSSKLPPIETLRSGWRDANSTESSGLAPIRLTDAPGLNATERSYLEAWQRQVQRVGRLNFPTDEKGNRLRGSLRLLAATDMNGALVETRITVSSGDARLDQAAIRIVELAAPFAPVPPAMRRGASVLEIERTWRIGASLIDL